MNNNNYTKRCGVFTWYMWCVLSGAILLCGGVRGMESEEAFDDADEEKWPQ